MKQSKIKNENHIIIQGWMVNELNLKGNELLIYSIIYGFSQDGQSKFTGSLQYLADWTNSTKQGCLKNLKNLLQNELILKEEHEINNIKYCTYSVNIEKVNIIKHSLIPIKQSLINNIDNNIDNSKLDKSNLEDNVEKDNLDIAVNIDKYAEVIIEKTNDKLLKENTKCIIDYLNESIGTNYRYDTKGTINLIKARFKEGYKLDDFYDVIDKKVKEWYNTEMQQYLRPSTLFGNKFEGYLNQTYFKGKAKSSYSSKPNFDNTSNHNVPKGVASMTEEEKQDFYQNNLAKDKNGNYIKF